MSDKGKKIVTKCEEYDALNTWREENFTGFAGESEYDPTVDAILAYEKAKAQEKKARESMKEERCNSLQ